MMLEIKWLLKYVGSQQAALRVSVITEKCVLQLHLLHTIIFAQVAHSAGFLMRGHRNVLNIYLVVIQIASCYSNSRRRRDYNVSEVVKSL